MNVQFASKRSGWVAALLVAAVLPSMAHEHPQARHEPTPVVEAAASAETGYVAVAADRGFQGNEEIRDAFDAFAAGRNAELVFATDERTRDSLDAALSSLVQRGARRVVVLPVFLSAADPKWRLARTLLEADREKRAHLPISTARPFGESYLAVEALFDRLRSIFNPKEVQLIVAGYGADNPETRRRLEHDWRRLMDTAAEGLQFAKSRVIVWYDAEAPERELRRAEARGALTDAAKEAKRAVVVSFHLGRRLDGMMSFDAELKQALPAGAELLGADPGPEAMLATWMTREANRHEALGPKEIGVIVLAHGSDHHWNETLRQAARPLEARHPVEYVFSMADQPLIERAVRRLERRGARAAVIVRVFGLVSSFEKDIERMIGADVEKSLASRKSHGEHANRKSTAPSYGHGHGHGEASQLAARIRSSLAIATVGGVEADSLFATALLDRARSLSRDPGTETVILTAHGAGEDGRNEHWLRVLEQLTAQMRSAGVPFRDVRYATWREDWPSKRGPWVAKVREMVEEARREGGRAIVIPARVNGQGPEREFLKGLDFELGSGFAPHPLFARWVEKQVASGVQLLQAKAEHRAGRLAAGHSHGQH